MKTLTQVIFLLCCLGISYGETPWYVSTACLETSPAEPGPQDVITLTLRGQWPDSCVPTQSRTRIEGDEIYVDLLDESADKMCAMVISSWSSAQTIGRLKKGVYDVYLTVYTDSWDSGKTALPYFAGTIHVSNKQFTPKKTSPEISHCEVIAGKTSDSISFSGTLDAGLADLQTAMADGNDIIVSIDANDIPDPNITRWAFPIDNKALKKEMYNYARTANASQQFFKLDTKNGKMQFSAKNTDLTGLACPFTVTITIGDYEAQIVLDEAVVNGTKPCPLPLMQGVKNSFDVTKSKFTKGKTTGKDSLTVSGTFTVAGDYLKAPLTITVGSQTFTVPIDKMGDKNNVASCNAKSTEGINAKLDYNKCTFTISIKNADITQSGRVDFGINCFDVNLTGLETIELQ